MTAITRNPARQHDLQSIEVIERLKLGDHLLIDEIASRLYGKILDVIDPEAQTINEQPKFEEKLKWVLHVQVEFLGSLHVCEEIVYKLVTAEGNNIHKLLQELSYKYFFLSEDLWSLASGIEYPTWNFLYLLEPSYYSESREMSAILLGELDNVLMPTSIMPSDSFQSFCHRLMEREVDKKSVAAIEVALKEWMLWSRTYRQTITFFYEVEAANEVLYLFHYIMSTAIRLLSLALSTRLLLNPLSSDLAQPQHLAQ